MTATRARFAFNALRSAVLTVAVAGAVYTMAGGLDTPGNVAGSVQQVGTVIRDHDSSRDTFNPGAQLDTTQVGRG